MPVKLEGREYRAMALLRPVDDGEKLIESTHYVQGYATTFDDPYPLYGDFKEVIDRHALDHADVSDVIMQYDHTGRVLARNRNATLIIRPDDHGLLIAADLSKGESARQLYEEIQNGLVDRMSWAFTVEEDSFNDSSDTRTILKIKKVYDVSAVSIPANDATDISARAFADGVTCARQLEKRAREMDLLKLRVRLLGD